MTLPEIARLQGMTTRRLLLELRYARTPAYYGCGDPYCGCCIPGPMEMERTIEAIKMVLATRPHVPNKQEARALRQERAKALQHRPRPRPRGVVR